MQSAGPSIIHSTLPHTLNVLVHVVFGTAAIGAGLVPIVTRKGGRAHRRFGRIFLACLGVVIVTAVIGVFAFNFRAFLGIITLLAAYNGYSGYRVLQTKAAGPQLRDTAAALGALALVAGFLQYLHAVRVPWAPVVIYSTLGSLVFVSAYDLVRLAFPRRWYGSLWLYEHLAKMLAAYSAVLSAFAGTVLVRWQPYSQIVPSALAVAAMVGFGVASRNNSPSACMATSFGPDHCRDSSRACKLTR